jgi:hypothetical protein
MEKTDYQRLNIQLERPVYNRLRDLSRLTDISVADLIRRCVDNALETVQKEVFADPKAKESASRAGDMLRTFQKAEE